MWSLMVVVPEGREGWPAGMAAQTVTVLRNEENDDCIDIQGRQENRFLASKLLEDAIKDQEWKETQS